VIYGEYMGFFDFLSNENTRSKVKHGGISNESSVGILRDYSRRLVGLLSLDNNETNELRAGLYLSFTQVAILNWLGWKGTTDTAPLVDLLAGHVRDFCDPYLVRVRELCRNKEEINAVLSCFPEQAQVELDTIINGLAVYDGFFTTIGPVAVDSILENKEVLMGNTGSDQIYIRAASILIVGFKESNIKVTEELILEVGDLIIEMTGKMVRSL
jgi:hypothetical protein